jgi:hypothetical protein
MTESDASQASGLAMKDGISLAFSALALLLSAWSFYKTVIEVDDNAQARIVGADIVPGDQHDSANGYIKGSIVVHVAYLNSGNRPALIMGTEYFLTSPSDATGIGFGGAAHVAPNTFPLVLSPHHVRVIDLGIPVLYIVDNYEQGSPLSKVQLTPEPTVIGKCKGGSTILRSLDGTPNDPALHRFFLRLDYAALDSNGETHNSTSGAQFKIDVTPKAWRSINPISENNCNEFPLTPILK